MRFANAVFFVGVLAISACGGGDENAKSSTEQSASIGPSIIGKIQNASGQKVELQMMDANTWRSMAVAEVGQDGSFSLKANMKGFKMYRLIIQGSIRQDYAMFILHHTENVTLTADANDLYNTVSVEGSENTALMNQFQREVSKRTEQIMQLREVAQNSDFDANTLRDSILTEIRFIQEEVVAMQKSFAIKYQGLVAGYMVAMDYMNSRFQMQTFNDDDIDFYTEVIEALRSKYPEESITTEAVSTYERFVSEWEYQKNQEQAMAAAAVIKVGEEAPDISQKNPSGKVISLKSLRGKVVLIDFWASWCGPCRKENPLVVQIYKKYQPMGFEIFSVSLDQDKQKWVEAIEQDQLNWPWHVSDLGGWNAAPAKQYGVGSIPYTVLIDKEGKVIEIGLRGQALEQKLKQIFGS